MSEPLLEVSHLSVHFPGRRAWTGWRAWMGATAPPLKAVDDVSFTLAPRESLGLVGESGSGKSTLARAILRLVGAASGSVRFDGIELLGLDGPALKSVRRRMQVIFQDPYASLNPRMTAAENIAEGLWLQGGRGRAARGARRAQVEELLIQVGLPADAADRYPHEFSGGQRQRIGIARALAVQPTLILADEPVSALDLSIQAQILNLLLDQQERRGLALLFIGHDLSVIRHFCQRIMVLYLGRVVEIGPTEAVFTEPRHPYTRALIESAPVTHPRQRVPRSPLAGEPPSPRAAPAGCSFSGRCPYAIDDCRRGMPQLRAVGPDHLAACIRDDVPRYHGPSSGKGATP